MYMYMLQMSQGILMIGLLMNFIIAGISAMGRHTDKEGKKVFSPSYAIGTFVRAVGFELLVFSFIGLASLSQFSVVGSNGSTANLDLMNQRVCGCVIAGCGAICGAVLMCYPKKDD